MDSASQTSSTDENITLCSSISDTAVDVETGDGCCAKDIVQQLMVQLKEKDEQLAKNKQEIMELQSKLDLMQVKTTTDELKTKLDMADEAEKIKYQQTILCWKSFPLPHLCYYIKVLGFYLYADKDGNLSPSWDDRPYPCAGQFKFTKHPNGSFSINSMSQEKYLEAKLVKTYLYMDQTAFIFTANDCSTINTKFELLLVQHKNKRLAASVDIRSLANDRFLSQEENWTNNNVTDSRTAPSKKFLIIPVDGQ